MGMDLMRQKKEKVMRMKKDEMINEMAMKQKERMNQERSASEYRFSDGTGFAGVHNIQKFSLEPTQAAVSGRSFASRRGNTSVRRKRRGSNRSRHELVGG